MSALPRQLSTLSADQVSDDRSASLLRLFPTLSLQRLDPFVVLDDVNVDPEQASWPNHTHRGFEALTYVLDGAVEHDDGAGNTRRVEAGGAQVVVAPPKSEHVETPVSGGRSRALKLWVNVDRSLEATKSDYRQIEAKGVPEARGAGVRVRTVAGDDSPLQMTTPVRCHDIALAPGASHEATIPSGWNGFAYVVDGQVQIGDATLEAGSAAFPGNGAFKIASAGDARVVVIAGQPHGA